MHRRTIKYNKVKYRVDKEAKPREEEEEEGERKGWAYTCTVIQYSILTR